VTEAHSLAVVGGGPRATYALERLSAQIGRLGPGQELTVHIFERTGQFGAGEAHSPAQPRTSFLNRIGSQVGFAADESVKGAGPLRPPQQRPSLDEWCRREFASTGHPDFDLGPDDWPKRYVHGVALRAMFDRWLADLRAQPGVTVRLHHAEVVDVARAGAGWTVRTAAGDSFPADQVLLVTGHVPHDPGRGGRSRALAGFAARSPAATYVASAYPLDSALSAGGEPGKVVGVAGMGLTAIDVTLHLTAGRGGEFVPDGRDRLRYRPSGKEPARIVAFSETGLFGFARPDNRKEADPERLEHRGVFLTSEAVDRLRESVGVAAADGRGPAQLDFERDLLPIVVLEMAVLHYRTLFGPAVGNLIAERAYDTYRAFLAGGAPHRQRPHDPARLLGPVERTVDEVAAGLDGEAGRRWAEVVAGGGLDPSPAGNRFDWARTLRPVELAAAADPAGYQRAVLDFMARDARWARQGNLDNPYKAAADGVWRDLRPVLSYAVDDGGLTPASHRTFLAVYARVHNRLANGAAVQVMDRIEALVRCGLVDLGAGPGATVVAEANASRFRVRGPVTGASIELDTLIEARIHPFDPDLAATPLYRRMARAGVVRPWRNTGASGDEFVPGGIDVDARFHPVSADGTAERTIAVLGPATEGRWSFLLSALRPRANHYVMRDILVWLEDFWSVLETA